MLPDIYICIYSLLFVRNNSDWNWDGWAGLVQFSIISYPVLGTMQIHLAVLNLFLWSEWF